MADASDDTMTNIPEADVAAPNEVAPSNAATTGNEAPKAARTELPKVPGNPILNWLLARRELAQAQAAAAQFSPEQREFLRHAGLALERGERAFAPGNAIRAGSTAPLAANLFRQAVYWALLVERPKAALVSPEQLWAETDRSLLTPAAGNESEYSYLTTAMGSTFIELADGTEEAQRASAIVLRRAATRLVANAQRVLFRLQWAKVKRAARVASLVVVLGLAIVAAWPKKPDLAKGMPWHTSSVGLVCHPEKSECGGVTTNILFHTLVEQNPWFECDFVTSISFSSLTIQNRLDYGQDRAVPLVVEVSDDDKVFREVARRKDPFNTWSPSFPTQRARYLRLRVARESILHLESVKVHP